MAVRYCTTLRWATALGLWPLLTAAYFIPPDGVPYRDLGPDHFERLDRGKLRRRRVSNIDFGYHALPDVLCQNSSDSCVPGSSPSSKPASDSFKEVGACRR